MIFLIFTGIEVVVVGEAFADIVKLVLLPHLSLGVPLSAKAAALRTVLDFRFGDHSEFRYSGLPILVPLIVSPADYNLIL